MSLGQPVVRVITGGVARDRRGFVQHVNAFSPVEADRFYVLHPANLGEVRGWVGHRRDAKWFFAVNGRFEIGVVAWPRGGQLSVNCEELMDAHGRASSATGDQSVKNLSRELPVMRYSLQATEPAVLEVPPGHFTAIIAGEPNSALLVFSTGTIETAKDDDYRLPPDYWPMPEPLTS